MPGYLRGRHCRCVTQEKGVYFLAMCSRLSCEDVRPRAARTPAVGRCDCSLSTAKRQSPDVLLFPSWYTGVSHLFQSHWLLLADLPSAIISDVAPKQGLVGVSLTDESGTTEQQLVLSRAAERLALVATSGKPMQGCRMTSYLTSVDPSLLSVGGGGAGCRQQ